MILQPDKSYTFSEIFELNISTAELVAEFGYTYQTERLDLARQAADSSAIEQLRAKFYRRLPHISFSSEIT